MPPPSLPFDPTSQPLETVVLDSTGDADAGAIGSGASLFTVTGMVDSYCFYYDYDAAADDDHCFLPEKRFPRSIFFTSIVWRWTGTKREIWKIGIPKCTVEIGDKNLCGGHWWWRHGTYHRLQLGLPCPLLLASNISRWRDCFRSMHVAWPRRAICIYSYYFQSLQINTRPLSRLGQTSSKKELLFESHNRRYS